MGDQFICFDARQRYTCIQTYLEREIDFDHFVDEGIIEAHYPMHKTKKFKDLKKSIDKYYLSLMKTFTSFGGNWSAYIQPIHLLKKYYGEKFAFYFVYFMHYQGQLILPSLLGLCLFTY